jgi:hypothetical protein
MEGPGFNTQHLKEQKQQKKNCCLGWWSGLSDKAPAW